MSVKMFQRIPFSFETLLVGHYIPQLAALLVEHNKKPNIEPVNLKAIAVIHMISDLTIKLNANL